MDSSLLYLLLGLFAVLVLGYSLLKKKALEEADEAQKRVPEEEPAPAPPEDLEAEIVISFQKLSSSLLAEDRTPSEITDPDVIAQLTALVPDAIQAKMKKRMKQAEEDILIGELYKMDIPYAQLAKSREKQGAVRAIAMDGEKKIRKNANATLVDTQRLQKTKMVANGTALAMNLGSMVVGEYYMKEIDEKLEKMTASIDRMASFQEQGFKSRILALIAQVQKYASFRSEIMEEDGIRLRILQVLEGLEGEAAELLGQVNIQASELVSKHRSPSYKDYTAHVDELYALSDKQELLLKLLEEISNLSYILSKGFSSRNLCYAVLENYQEQSEKARRLVEQWHRQQVAALKIDLEKERKSKGRIASLPGIVHEDWKYQALREGLVEKIQAQCELPEPMKALAPSIYEDKVEVLLKDGRYYYLPKAK